MKGPIDWALVRHVVALIIVFATTFALSASVTIFNKWFFTDCKDKQPGCDHPGLLTAVVVARLPITGP
jgi:hypothetical protein